MPGCQCAMSSLPGERQPTSLHTTQVFAFFQLVFSRWEILLHLCIYYNSKSLPILLSVLKRKLPLYLWMPLLWASLLPSETIQSSGSCRNSRASYMSTSTLIIQLGTRVNHASNFILRGAAVTRKLGNAGSVLLRQWSCVFNTNSVYMSEPLHHSHLKKPKRKKKPKWDTENQYVRRRKASQG